MARLKPCPDTKLLSQRLSHSSLREGVAPGQVQKRRSFASLRTGSSTPRRALRMTPLRCVENCRSLDFVRVAHCARDDNFNVSRYPLKPKPGLNGAPVVREATADSFASLRMKPLRHRATRVMGLEWLAGVVGRELVGDLRLVSDDHDGHLVGLDVLAGHLLHVGW